MNFRQVRKKIKTIGNVKKITKAMQMVAAVKMKKSQERALEGKLYKDILFTILKQVSKNREIPFIEKNTLKKTDIRETDKTLYIVIGSQKGLCGNYHLNMVKYLLKNVSFDNASFIVAGNKMVQFLVRMKAHILADFSQTIPLIDSVSSLFSLVLNSYKNREYSRVILIYTRFYSTFRFEPVQTAFLPLESDTVVKTTGNERDNDKIQEYIIEPSQEKLLESLIRDVLIDMLRTSIYDSEASEYSARMMAMKNATENAENIIFNLTLLRNKLRQEAITNELLDMVSATSV